MSNRRAGVVVLDWAPRIGAEPSAPTDHPAAGFVALRRATVQQTRSPGMRFTARRTPTRRSQRGCRDIGRLGDYWNGALRAIPATETPQVNGGLQARQHPPALPVPHHAHRAVRHIGTDKPTIGSPVVFRLEQDSGVPQGQGRGHRADHPPEHGTEGVQGTGGQGPGRRGRPGQSTFITGTLEPVTLPDCAADCLPS